MPLWFYPRILSIVPCAVSRILLFIHPVYNTFASDNPRLPTYPAAPSPRQPQVCEPVLFRREVPLCRILDSKALLNVIYHLLAMTLILCLLPEPESFLFAL